MTENDTLMEYSSNEVDNNCTQEDYEEDVGFDNDIDLGEDFQNRGRSRGNFRYVKMVFHTSLMAF